MNYNEALKTAIFIYISGSRQYGTNRPDSDTDLRGVYIIPFHHHFELYHSRFIGEGTIKQNLEAAKTAIEENNNVNALNLITTALQTDRCDLSVNFDVVNDPNEDSSLYELRKFFKLCAECNPNVIEALFVEHLIQLETPIWKKIRSNRHLFLSKKCKFTFCAYAMAVQKMINKYYKCQLF